MVDLAAREFEETETFIKTAESLVGPYVWGRYDLLVSEQFTVFQLITLSTRFYLLLFPMEVLSTCATFTLTFIISGMENPCMTFLTPTLLAGDRSNADVVAHEVWGIFSEFSVPFFFFFVLKPDQSQLDRKFGDQQNLGTFLVISYFISEKNSHNFQVKRGIHKLEHSQKFLL